MGSVCWEQVVKVVADYPFYGFRLAKKIAGTCGIDYSVQVSSPTKVLLVCALNTVQHHHYVQSNFVLNGCQQIDAPCINLQERERRMNIPQEISDFGLFLLEDHNGVKIRSKALKHMNFATEINQYTKMCWWQRQTSSHLEDTHPSFM